MRKPDRKITYLFLFNFLFILSACFIFLYSFFVKTSPINFINNILSSGIFPPPHWNGFYDNTKSAYLYIYFILLLGSFILFINTKSKVVILRFLFTGWALIFFIQILRNNEYLLFLRRSFWAKDQIERKKIHFGKPFLFSLACQGHLKRPCKGRLITDLTINDRDYIDLAYHLYPAINLRFHDANEEPECLVYYEAYKNFKDLPSGYRVKYKLDNNNFLAVRE